jgi:hypothetical protein
MWSTDGSVAIVQLARSFPALAGAPLEPWDPIGFYLWALPTSHGARCAAHFVLQVWNCRTDWDHEVRANLKERGIKAPRGRLGTPRFDLLDAMTVWDEHQKAAFLAWVREPFWP